MIDSQKRRMPAEWEPQRAVWIAWPHEPEDWPGKLEAINWVYVEIVRALCSTQPVEILCHNEEVLEKAKHSLDRSGIREGFCLHKVPNDRAWLRDSAPTAVRTPSGVEWISWSFNAWAKYDNYLLDREVGSAVAELSGQPLTRALRPDNREPLVLEGGAIETDGEGTLITTEQCLLSEIQQRNPGLSREGYEKAFEEYLGVTKTIWLGDSCEGDDTHGHVDDVARFVAPGKVVLYFDHDPASSNHKACLDNLERLKAARDALGRQLEIFTLPAPGMRVFDGDVLPQSYTNFFIANKLVLVPTFNDEADSEALQTLRRVFKDRKVIGIDSSDLILGLGALHCLSQQEPEM